MLRRKSSRVWSVHIAAIAHRCVGRICTLAPLGCQRRFLLDEAARWLRRAGLPHAAHKPLALLAQDALDASNRVTFAIEEMTNAAQEIDVLGAVIAPAPSPLHRPDLME